MYLHNKAEVPPDTHNLQKKKFPDKRGALFNPPLVQGVLCAKQNMKQ